MSEVADADRLKAQVQLPRIDENAKSRALENLSYQSSSSNDRTPKSAASLLAPNFQLEGFQALPDSIEPNLPGPSGAVSADHVVTAQNNGIRVQDRKGTILKTVSLETFFAAAGPYRLGLLSPRVSYDRNAKRFLLAALADPFETTAGIVLAVSKTSDPRGEWKMSKISAPYASTYFGQMQMAIAGKIVAISADLFLGPFYDSTQNYLFNVTNLYPEGSFPIYQKFEDYLSGNSPSADSNPDATRILFVNNTYNLQNGNYALAFKEASFAPGGGSFNVGTRSYADAGDFAKYVPGEILPQAGTDKKIDAGDSMIQSCVTRDTSVWCVNTMFVQFGTGIRSVVQYTKVNWPTTGAAITMSERVRVDDTSGASYYAFPSIAVNKNGELFIGYNRFHKDKFVGSYFATRKPSDTPGALYADGLIKEGEDSFERGFLMTGFGPYSSTQVDPADDTSFWTLQSYAASRTDGGSTTWGTWWAHYGLHNGACTVKLDQSSVEVPVAGGNFKIAVTPSYNDCGWMVAPNAGWLSQASPATTTGAATVEFKASANKRGQLRSGTIRIGDQLLTVRQAANPAPPAAEPTLSILRFTAPSTVRVGETILLNVQLTNKGTKAAPRLRIGFYLGTGTTVTKRDYNTGFICLLPNGIPIDATTTCTASLPVDNTFVPGTYQLAAIADDGEEVPMTDRSAATRLSDAGPLVIKAAATAPAVTSAAIVNGATAVSGPVAPGSILVLYGARLGPAALTTLTLTSQGRVSTLLGGTRVLFDDAAAPLIYTSAGQLSAIVPYSVAGKTTTQVSVELNGLRSDPVAMQVTAASPDFFTTDYSGKNQVAALNEDGSVNSAANPIAVGSVIVLYGTGAGTLSTTPVDGAVIGVPLPEFLAPLSLKIGGLDAELLYAGPAPGLVSGVFQINARVPVAIEPGDKIAISVKAGAIESPVGATIAVK
ncbi:CARDB domain-containing protein [Bryobacter aggregatus]|uniref:CARDB domain-containing protein n=1 Tax=Bryobacter aggregatus TaxID=360054 RepID=UPI0004E21D52|nr:CARDB domain-containing protein [Bryobacter aggregatus]